ncbi:MAG TPA: hypothetical protein VJ900_02545 [Patescibacteria group bacterium]|nr:hypothetical protein [Patescibacteria group bacterium]
MEKIFFPYSAICLDCAQKLNPNIPDNHIIGMWSGICPVCKRKTYLAHPGHDFNIVTVSKEKLEKLTK